jgi:O-antigen ligase
MKSSMVFITPEAAAKWLSNFGLAVCVVVAGLLICNQYSSLSTLIPYYRINTPALCLMFGFVTACFGMRPAIAGCVFALPLVPTFAWQLQLYTGYGRVQDVTSAGLDLVAGALLGLIVNTLWRRQSLRGRLALPWPAGLVILILTISVAVAIARNLHQTASPFVPRALLYNLMHLRMLGWHDDYRPLVDWVAYGSAFLLLAMFAPALKAMSDRNDVIFKPLIAGLVIAALVGFRQSIFGAGLNSSQINFRMDEFGFMALGFQPDLHAFAAHMLLGVIGLFGYLYIKNNLWLRALVLGLVLPLCGVLLFLSKSKSTFALAIFCLLLMALLWIFRNAKYFKSVVLSVLACSVLVIISVPIFTDVWSHALGFILHSFSLPDLIGLNLKLSYRPEVYLAAFRMFALFPFAGLGQGEFYHQSANHELTQSLFLSLEQNGEHAHNYFLQTLVENGILGFAAFVLLLSYPVIRAVDKRALIPGLVALTAVFGGNLFSHSMLVRENLLLAACFVALMYAAATKIPLPTTDASPSPVTQRSALSNQWLHDTSKPLIAWLTRPTVFTTCILIAVLLVIKEAYQSLKGRPFNLDIQCQEKPRLERDGWTSGRFIWDMPVGAQSMILNLDDTQPDVVKRPLPGTLTVWFDQRVLLKKDILLTKTGRQSLEVALPEGMLATPDDYQIELQIQRCFVPRNFGMSADARRLGVRVESTEWRY